jgi:hypothetical protein
MDRNTAKFISTINWIAHVLGEDLRYTEIDYKQRLIETQKQLEKTLEDFTNDHLNRK